MSRLKHYTRSMLSSYGLMGVNVVYTLLSWPLAMRYLSKAEFGLWALTLQVAGYIALIDMGMGSSIARILIDHKDDRASGRYGGAIKSGFLVGLTQGGISLLVGLSIVWFLGDWLRVDAEFRKSFLWLMIGQVFITAATFSTRIFNQILYAWQRIDVFNYAGMVQLIIGLGALWLAFHLRFGVFSLLVGAVVGWICGLAVNLAMSIRLGFLPRRGEWGRASRAQFQELFNYGADLFLITIGTQLIISSQTVLVSRQMGMDMAALWTVMTKVFAMLSQAVWRIIGNAMPVFAEMHVRKEHERLWSRYRVLFIAVSLLSVFCAVIFAACNGPFINLWMGRKFSWPAVNDVLLGIWLVFSTQQCCHNSLIACLKEIRGLKYVFVVEGVVFVITTAVILPQAGITGMLICSVAATVFFTWTIGLWKVAHLPGGNVHAVLWGWQLPSIKLLLLMLPAYAVGVWMSRNAPDWLRFFANAGLLAVVGGVAVLYFALPTDLVAALIQRMPARFRRITFLKRWNQEVVPTR